MINLEFMKESAKKEGFVINDDMLYKLDKYADLLVEWNEKVNLTAIVEPDEIVIKHFVDSFLLLNNIPKTDKISLIDVGTGAGFPSLPCKIVRDDIKLTLLDSLNKRISFLNEVINQLDINAECVHGRAEGTGQNVEFREKYDAATARAVAHLRELTEYCLPFVKVGGFFVALKGYDIEQELEESKSAVKLLGGEIIDVKKHILQDGSKRSIIIIKKISQTPTKYPRNFGKMKKQPLK